MFEVSNNPYSSVAVRIKTPREKYLVAGGGKEAKKKVNRSSTSYSLYSAAATVGTDYGAEARAVGANGVGKGKDAGKKAKGKGKERRMEMEVSEPYELPGSFPLSTTGATIASSSSLSTYNPITPPPSLTSSSSSLPSTTAAAVSAPIIPRPPQSIAETLPQRQTFAAARFHTFSSDVDICFGDPDIAGSNGKQNTHSENGRKETGILLGGKILGGKLPVFESMENVSGLVHERYRFAWIIDDDNDGDGGINTVMVGDSGDGKSRRRLRGINGESGARKNRKRCCYYTWHREGDSIWSRDWELVEDAPPSPPPSEQPLRPLPAHGRTSNHHKNTSVFEVPKFTKPSGVRRVYSDSVTPAATMTMTRKKLTRSSTTATATASAGAGVSVKRGAAKKDNGSLGMCRDGSGKVVVARWREASWSLKKKGKLEIVGGRGEAWELMVLVTAMALVERDRRRNG